MCQQQQNVETVNVESVLRGSTLCFTSRNSHTERLFIGPLYLINAFSTSD